MLNAIKILLSFVDLCHNLIEKLVQFSVQLFLGLFLIVFFLSNNRLTIGWE